MHVNLLFKKIAALIPCLLLTVALNAQTVTKAFRSVPLKTVLEEVERQTGYSILFENEDVDVSMLLPATVALAIPLYEKLDLLKANAAAIIAGISVGTLVSLGSALALALALHLTQEQYATLLPKSVTTAISMDVAAELGGIAALTGAIVILTGIVGNLLAETVCKAFHITDPIAKGVGIGTSAHAVGTSKALQMGEVEGAMSGLSIAVAGVLTAVLCPVFVSLID